MCYLIRVKDGGGGSMTGSFDLPDENEFDHDMQLILTRKQTKDVKTNPKKFKFIAKSSPFDYLDLYDKKFYTLNFRVVRFAISEDSYESIITNLPKEDFPVEEIKKVYAMRWHRNIVQGIEICYRIMLLSFKKGGVYHARNIRTFNPLQLL